MTVHNAKFEDVALAARIMVTSFRRAFADFVSPKTMDTCTNPNSFYYFIKAGEETVGCIRVADAGNGTRKRIAPLYILPAHRGKGYAQAAILEAECIHGNTGWQLDTILQETGNCYLYEKMGYRQTAQRTVINDRMTIVGYEKD